MDSSSDEYSDTDSRSESEKVTIQKNIDKFSIDKYKAKKAPSAVKGRDSASHHFGNADFSYLHLKPDHDNRTIMDRPKQGANYHGKLFAAVNTRTGFSDHHRRTSIAAELPSRI